MDSIDAGHPEGDASLVAAGAWTRQAKGIMLPSVFEGRLSRVVERRRTGLKAIPAERKEARENALHQATLFVEHAAGKGKEYDPGEDFQPVSAQGGFEFSAAEIAARRDRERRYEAATRYPFRDRSKDPRPNQGPQVDLQAA
jgi:hypothetical protein